MRAKTGAWRNPVLVDDAQIAPSHVLRVVVAGEGKTMERLQPPMVSVAAII
jgi:hypothetical protein